MTWPTAKIGEVCDVVSGATPRTREDRYWDGNVPWVTPKDLSNLKRKHLSDTPRKITSEGFKSCSVQMLPAQSVLFSSRAPIGLVAINTIPVCTNQGFKSMVPHADRISADYLYWWLSVHSARIQELGRGATFKEVSKKIVEDLRIPLPPLPQQKRIAAILDKADAIRRKRQQAIDLTDQLLRSTFLEMFGDEIGSEDPRRTAPLQEFIDPERPITYGILKPGPNQEAGIPYVRVVDLQAGRVATKNLRRTTEKIALSYQRSLLRPKDLLISIRGHVGRLAIVPPELAGANITQDTARIAGAEDVDNRFLLGFLASRWAQRWMAQRTKGAAVKGINLRDLRKIPVPRVSPSRQLEFGKVLQQLWRSEDRSRAFEHEADELFGSLSQRAFNGEL